MPTKEQDLKKDVQNLTGYLISHRDQVDLPESIWKTAGRLYIEATH